MISKSHLFFDELAARIALIKKDGGIAQSDHIAEDVLIQHPDCGMTLARITDEIVWLATSVGVAVEIGDGIDVTADHQTLQ